jgi:AGZA family xanthine/uracil permease-like MFS transporter
MPLSYSISDGIMMGVIMYVLMKTGIGMKGIRQISPTMWGLFVLFILRYVQRSL